MGIWGMWPIMGIMPPIIGIWGIMGICMGIAPIIGIMVCIAALISLFPGLVTRPPGLRIGIY